MASLSSHFIGMNFSSLPSDILSNITQYLDGYEIVRLVLCGSKKLNAGLQLGVTRFDLSYHLSNPVTWPRMLRNFHGLQDCSLTLTSQCFLLPINLKDLSSNLRMLRLSSLNALCFLMEKPTPTKDYPVPHYHTLVDLDSRFPSLCELELGGSHSLSRPLIMPRLDFFSRLPRQLKVFRCSATGEVVNFMASQLYFLPSSLEELTIAFANISTIPEHWNYKFQHSFENIIDDKQLAQAYNQEIQQMFERDTPMPPNLKSLVFVPYNEEIFPQSANNFFIFNKSKDPPKDGRNKRSGRPGFHVVFRDSTFHLCSILPASVTHLYISSWTKAPKLSPNGILPPNIISYSSMLGRHIETFNHLPPNITSISAPYDVVTRSVSPDFIKYLPRTLTVLNISSLSTELWSEEDEIDAWKNMPPKVIQCSFTSSFATRAEHIPFVPKNLRFLELSSDVGVQDLQLIPSDTGLRRATVAGVTDEFISALPRTLTSLSIKSTYPTYTGNCTYPPQLQCLIITSVSNVDSPIFSGFPKNLTRLIVDCPFYVGWLHLLPPSLAYIKFNEYISHKFSKPTPTAVESWEIRKQQRLLLDSHPDWISFPSSLTSFNGVIRYSSEDFEGVDVEALHANDPKLPWFFELIRKMPQSLRDLDNGTHCSSSDEVNAERYLDNFNRIMFSILPPRLVQYTTQVHAISDSHLDLLPSSLTYLHLYGNESKLTRECLSHLPPKIVVFRMRKVGGEKFEIAPSKFPPNLVKFHFIDNRGLVDYSSVPRWFQELRNSPRCHDNLENFDFELKLTVALIKANTKRKRMV